MLHMHQDWIGRCGTPYTCGRQRVRAIVALIYFLGGFRSTAVHPGDDTDDEMDGTEDSMSDGSDHIPDAELDQIAFDMQERYESAASDLWEVTDRRAEIEFIAQAEGREQWRATSTPDAIFAPKGTTGGAHERLLDTACCAVYAHSAQQRATSDSIPAVLELLAVGALLCVAREAELRALTAPPAGLRAPVLVAGFPGDWKERRHSARECIRRPARLYMFKWHDGAGVTCRRSDPLSLEAAFRRIHTHTTNGLTLWPPHLP